MSGTEHAGPSVIEQLAAYVTGEARASWSSRSLLIRYFGYALGLLTCCLTRKDIAALHARIGRDSGHYAANRGLAGMNSE